MQMCQEWGAAIQVQRKIAGFLALSLIWGSTWAAIRIVVRDVPPLRGVALRFFLAAMILLPLMLLRRSRWPRGKEWLVLTLTSTLLTALPFSMTAWAEQWVNSGKTSILYAFTPLLTAGVERWLGRGAERRALSKAALGGLLLGMLGTTLLVGHAISMSRDEGRGALMIVAVVVLASFTIVPAKRWLSDIPVITVAAVTTLIAAGVMAAVSLAVEGDRPSAWTSSSVEAILFLALFSSAAGFLLYYWLLQQMQPHQLVARHFLMPVVALVEATAFLHEPFSWQLAAGMVAVLAGLVLVLRDDHRMGAQLAAR